MKKIAVIGIGRFGSTLVKELSKMKFEVLAIDNDEQRVNEILPFAAHGLILDSSNINSLIDAGLKTFDTVVVGIGENIESSILTTLLLKEIGVKNVIARALNNYHGLILSKIGADKIVYPEQETGIKLAKIIASPILIDYIEMADGFAIVEMNVPDNMCNKPLSELELRAKYGINVVAIKRGSEINRIPGGNDILKKNDIILVSGQIDNISKLKHL
ncbi:MAG: TrkA family potassium uptake protein [bacterium]